MDEDCRDQPEASVETVPSRSFFFETEIKDQRVDFLQQESVHYFTC